MKKLSLWVLQTTAALLLFAAAAAAQAQEQKADPVGSWTWTMETRGGQQSESTLTIKKDGDKLTGVITGRQGRETKIDNIKFTGNELTFDVKREFQGNSITAKYKGKITGDTLTGTISTERNGETRERPWTAKRKKVETKTS